MTNNKTVSIHIVTYNSEEDILDCLEAVLHQDYPVEQVIIVDNSSTDGTVERVKRQYRIIEQGNKRHMADSLSIEGETQAVDLGKRIRPDKSVDGETAPYVDGRLTAIEYSLPHEVHGKIPSVCVNPHDGCSFAEMSTCPLHLLHNPTNTGFAPAHNQAIDLSDADYVLVLNPDVTLAPDYVSRLVARMEADPRIGSATGKLLFKKDPGTVDSTGLRMNRARRAFDRGAGEPAENWTESGEVFGVSGAAAMYSRRMIEVISVDGEFFDEDFFAYKEDVDVAWRARLLGWKAYYDAEAVGYHERGWKVSGRSGKPLFIRQFSYINRYKMLFKNEPVRTILWTLLCALPYEIAAHGYMLLKEPSVLKAWGGFVRQWGSLRSKRQTIQRRARLARGGGEEQAQRKDSVHKKRS